MAGARWVRLDVDYFGNPKVVGLSAPAKLLHVASICWCGAHLTDGHIKAGVVPSLLYTTGAKRRHVAELIEARLWYEVDGDYLIHDYTAMQPSRVQVEAERRKNAERLARWRAKNSDV